MDYLGLVAAIYVWSTVSYGYVQGLFRVRLGFVWVYLRLVHGVVWGWFKV